MWLCVRCVLVSLSPPLCLFVDALCVCHMLSWVYRHFFFLFFFLGLQCSCSLDSLELSQCLELLWKLSHQSADWQTFCNTDPCCWLAALQLTLAFCFTSRWRFWIWIWRLSVTWSQTPAASVSVCRRRYKVSLTSSGRDFNRWEPWQVTLHTFDEETLLSFLIFWGDMIYL